MGRTVNSAQLLPAIRDLYSRRPEYFHYESWELAHVLFSPGLAEAVAICKETRRSKRISLWWGCGIQFDRSNTKKGDDMVSTPPK